MIVRPLDNLGRIVLPKELRGMLGIEDRDLLEFFVTEDGLMIQKYYAGACRFCGVVNRPSYFKGIIICSDCIRFLKGDSDPESIKPEVPTGELPTKFKRRSLKVTLQELSTLLEQHPQMTQNEIAAMMGLSPGRISQLKKQLNIKQLMP
ncbi:AbrB/MazE/SpoVT family DNA-binding domain-containing protein [Paenibacillus jiagnxiensis]|uniref:AbrB/MazE/SpoVT family DNA-binding domain-containing protein n=1 Tax=Paenibacillus jiagnxiensis TaxID=3228926 RepID=UPI0033BDD95B